MIKLKVLVRALSFCILSTTCNKVLAQVPIPTVAPSEVAQPTRDDSAPATEQVGVVAGPNRVSLARPPSFRIAYQNRGSEFAGFNGQWFVDSVRANPNFVLFSGGRYNVGPNRWDWVLGAHVDGFSLGGGRSPYASSRRQIDFVFLRGRGEFVVNSNGLASTLVSGRVEIAPFGFFSHSISRNGQAPSPFPQTTTFFEVGRWVWLRDNNVGIRQMYEFRSGEAGVSQNFGSPRGIRFGFFGSYSGPGYVAQQIEVNNWVNGQTTLLPVAPLGVFVSAFRTGVNTSLPTGGPVVFHGTANAEYRIGHSADTDGGGRPTNASMNHLFTAMGRIATEFLFTNRPVGARFTVYGGVQYRLFWYGENPRDPAQDRIRSQRSAVTVDIGGALSY